ncbi:hydrogen gas-evolving membrane-bound hydrogenase subunit E [Inediibacterium massiliense]|uniref:hydrogen gas-evolving membrane-bound hydrogenase subunit E n=1 Tax=Inediibacterium massiliense TaxID=1658111 RepID=UPI0006B41C83|nr:hydrogen gas-evolving membrane-bound hydrogenase subunit E [Inediibacterium massiliense]
MRKIMAVFLTILIIGILLIGVKELPPLGESNNPAHNEVMDRYVQKGVEETGALNTVTGIILDYRAFDTFGEATVLFTGAIVVLTVLKRDERK